MQTGAIISVRHHFNWTLISFIQCLIRLVTGGKVDHTAILIIKKHNVYIIEAGAPYGVRMMIFDEWVDIPGRTLYFSAPTKKINKEGFIKEAEGMLNEQYDYLAIFQQLWYQIFRRFNQRLKWFGRTANGKAADKFYCSEMAAYLHRIDKWWMMTPQDIYKNSNFVEWMKCST